MLKLRIELLTAMLLLIFGCLSVTECGAQKGSGASGAQKGGKPASTPPANVKTQPSATPADELVEEPARGGEGRVMSGEDLKVLAEGQYGTVEQTFVAVVRDVETYAALRSLAALNLPPLNGEFFSRSAVVAAFLGTRRSGGYGIQITRQPDRTIRIEERTPPKGSMTTMALTAPYKIVSVALNEQSGLKVGTGEAWTSAMRLYRVTTGEFTTSGGFTGRMQKFSLEGELRAARLGKLLSIAFSLRSTAGSPRTRALDIIATGSAGTDGQITLPNFEAGTLMDWPHGNLRATGRFTTGEEKISLSLNSMPIPRHSESYSGSGQLEAQAR